MRVATNVHVCVVARAQGDTGERRLPSYSRGIRQKLARLARERDWQRKYSIMVRASGFGLGLD